MERFAAGPPPDAVHDLVRAAQRGDPAAMDGVMRALAPYVRRVCGAIALDAGDDAVQETFIVVLRKLGDLREPEALHGWVRTIAVREAVRVARRDVHLVADGVGIVEAAAPSVDLASVLDVRAALAGLTPEHRAVLVLRDLDGLSEAETARLLEVPAGTVKSRLHRARAAVKEVLSR
jgi:RNA polymerase sigma-70 factor (ECF subfamily)